MWPTALRSEEPTPLVYNGEIINARDEMLSLTDMWRAAGSPVNREPFNWARFEGKAFIEAVALAHNLSDTQVMEVKRGRGGGTLAHWQIAMAYAKALNPRSTCGATPLCANAWKGARSSPAPASSRGPSLTSRRVLMPEFPAFRARAVCAIGLSLSVEEKELARVNAALRKPMASPPVCAASGTTT